MTKFITFWIGMFGMCLGNITWQFMWGQHDVAAAMDHTYWEFVGCVSMWLVVFSGLKQCRLVMNSLFGFLEYITREK